MRVSDRHRLILAAVQQRGVVTINDVIELGNTSEATVRRDLRDLAGKGLIRRTHGGASLINREALQLGKGNRVAAEKQAIALAAAQMISNGDTVAIGAGTTTFALAQRLAAVDDLTVVTNSMLVSAALEHAPNVHLIVCGGLLRSGTHALVGPIAEQTLSEMHVPTLYLSGDGLTADRGLSTTDVLSAAVDKQMAVSAARVVVLIGHSKIGVESIMRTVTPSQIFCVITGDAEDSRELDLLRRRGIEIVVAATDANLSALEIGRSFPEATDGTPGGKYSTQTNTLNVR